MMETECDTGMPREGLQGHRAGHTTDPPIPCHPHFGPDAPLEELCSIFVGVGDACVAKVPGTHLCGD
jgi:hypothetical protein